MPGGFGGTDIYVTDVNKDGSLGTPENLGNVVNTEKNESFPFIYSKERTLYFSSDGHVGKGLLDIFLALQDKNNHIVNVINLGVPINSEKDDFAYFLSPNGQDGYISSNRKGGVGGDDIYSFTILSKSFLVSGKAIDSETGNILASTKIILSDEKGNFIDEILTIEDGSYKFEIEPANNYKLKAEKEGYLRKTVNLIAEITKSAEMKNHQVMDFYLDKIEIGTDIGKLVDIKLIYFDLSKWNIRKDATAELDKIVKVMNENPTMEIELSSHTDCRSSAASNMLLSNRRAQATAEYIKKKISNSNRISGKGYGESMLINYCECEADKKVPCTEKEHQMNRRTEFKILKY
jgi:outer membrane protein OmpA-like peptidoglycan-associated protein